MPKNKTSLSDSYPPEDVRLIRKAQRGDAQAMREVIEQYKHIARSLANRFKKNKHYNDHDIEDMYQEGLIVTVKCIEEYGKYLDDDGNIHPLWRTIWFKIRSDAGSKRKTRVRKDSKEQVTKTGELYFTAEQALEMDEAMGEQLDIQETYSKAWEYAKLNLTPEKWITWRLYYGRDMREVDIAEELNITRQAVNVRLQTARKIVREAFRYEGFRFGK